MADPALPSGMYLTLNHKMPPSTGGRTRALMMRSRMITERFGVPSHVLTLDSEINYDEIRTFLTDLGELTPGVSLVNMFEWLRTRDFTELEVVGSGVPESLPPLDNCFTEDIAHHDGTVHYTSHRTRNTLLEIARDYRRADGTVFLRSPSLVTESKDTPFFLVDSTGRPIRKWRSEGQLHTFWLKAYVGDAERVFVVCDRRTVTPPLLPFADSRFHFFLVLHNNHFYGGGRHWNSAVVTNFLPVLEKIADYDGLVTLTHQQRGDVAARWGDTDNLVVVPNATELPRLPDPLPAREPATFTVVARLDREKRLTHAVDAFSLVLEQRPQARLQIYGEGRARAPIAARIEELDLGASIQLMGHDPRAREALLTSTGFLMTSYKEGFPMATLEALTFGCPVVSYDVKYGPAEQITDGVDGFIVPEGDREAMAARIIELIDDPELVARLSRNAFAKAKDLTWENFADHWIAAFEGSVARKASRIGRLEATLTIKELGWLPQRQLPGRLGRVRASAAAWRDSRPFRIRASVRLAGKLPPGAIDEARLSLDAVSFRTGHVRSLPLTVDRHQRRFDVASDFDIADAFADAPADANDLRLRLRIVMRNWSWQTELGDPERPRPNFEVVFDESGTVELHRGLPSTHP